MAAYISLRGVGSIRCTLTQTSRTTVSRNISCQPRLILLQKPSNRCHICTNFTPGQWRTLGLGVGIRYNSNDWSTTADQTTITDVTSQAIHSTDPLSPVSIAPDAAQIIEQVKEVPISELGLGGATPIGFIQSILEAIHIDFHLPWWGAIALGTVLARILIFPVYIKAQKNAIQLNNVMPTMQKMSKRMSDARKSGNEEEIAMAAHELQLFMKRNNVNPLKSFLIPLAQAPIFISFFIGLRRMATLPVESMKTGGLYWFTDLTVADPYYILPVVASLTMLASIELGGEGVQNPQMQHVKIMMRIMPFAVLPVMASMPTAVFTYWCTSNAFTLSQIALLKIPQVRTYFDIPERIQHQPKDLQPATGGFFKSMKSGFKNAEKAYEIHEREQALSGKYSKSGKKPVSKR
ncbi:mitochondrial inner membrane protein OXA1L-like [Glandiceps talaboti]